LRWAEHQLEERGAYIITVARFIPGGRTATTFSAGYVEFTWRRFLVFDAIACSIWGSYTVLLGYFGGSQFEEAPWKGLLLAFGIALAVAGAIEAVRYLRHRRAV
jgi:membrane protein DedA with SNARE-associated domain